MAETMQSEELKRYLFLQLSDAERQTIEERFLEDTDYFDEMLELENDLVHGYVRNTLTDKDRQSFEQTLVKLPARREKLANARVLQTYINQRQVSEPEPVPTIWERLLGFFRSLHFQYAFGVLTVLLICVTVLLFYQNRRTREELAALQNKQSAEIAEKERLLQQQTEDLSRLKQSSEGISGENEVLTEQINEIEKQNERLEQELKALRQKNQLPDNRDKPNSLPQPVFAFLLPSGRGGEQKNITAGTNVNLINFRLQIPSASQAVTFSVKLNGNPVAENLKARQTPSGSRILSLSLPARKFDNGNYQLTVTGNDGFEDNYTFRFQKR